MSVAADRRGEVSKYDTQLDCNYRLMVFWPDLFRAITIDGKNSFC